MLSPVLKALGRMRKSRPFSEFMPFKETLAAAKAAGLSVGEYIERRHLTGSQSARDETIDGMASFGVFTSPIERVCEIGPGSGRYLERTIARCHPRTYEIYETSSEWRNWLIEQYGVIARSCDGRNLAETESGSVDLVHAHKVFSGLPFLVNAYYFREMARVVRDGGWVVFDLMTESCFTKELLDAWFAADPWEWEWSPHMVARDYALNTFTTRGFSLVGSFQVPNFPAVTECIVFRKVPPDNNMSRAK
jgi:SAM-dependent methyltransferase